MGNREYKMLVVNSKTPTDSSPLSLGIQELPQEKGTLSFSELLHGVASKKVVLALDEESPEAKDTLRTLSSLLKNEIPTAKEELSTLGLNPKVVELMTPSELKVLIKDAKEYLKNKITTLQSLTKEEMASLPKTLKGLAQVASKIGIKVTKITLEELQPKAKNIKLPTIPETPKEVLSEKSVVESMKKVKTHTHKLQTTQIDQEVQNDSKFQEQIKRDSLIKEASKEIPKEIKATPLFKAHSSNEITTQQLVQTKVNVHEPKTTKEKTHDTLKLLLRGEKAVKNDGIMTADFSVATARVIAPTPAKHPAETLESLLSDDKQESSAKLDGMSSLKADSFEVKLNEAKQMTKYLSQDVKTAIEDYKSPFTRVKVQLNPQKLGEVDLTIVQRGKNLHINLSSNNAAIHTLSMNVSDLKTQLNNNGINNASLNFNNMSQDGSASQQHNHQNRQQAHEEYNYFEGDETHEEITSSLEIIVPNYA